MAVTRSTAAERLRPRPAIAWRPGEALWLLAASLVLLFGFVLVYQAKSRGFAQIESGLAGKQLLNLNDLGTREELLPFLGIFAEPAERQFVARRIYDASGGLPNVGALARLRVTGAEIRGARGLKSLGGRSGLTLLTGEQFRQLKPLFVTRRPAQFRRAFFNFLANPPPILDPVTKRSLMTYRKNDKRQTCR